MGFRTSWSKFLEACNKADTPVSKVASRMGSDPVVVELVHAFYNEHPFLKKTLCSKLDAAIEILSDPSLLPVDQKTETNRRLVYIFSVLSKEEHSSDPSVKRWARVAASLHGKKEGEELSPADVICLLVDKMDPSGESLIRTAFHASLDWTLSECRKVNDRIFPFCG